MLKLCREGKITYDDITLYIYITLGDAIHTVVIVNSCPYSCVVHILDSWKRQPWAKEQPENASRRA